MLLGDNLIDINARFDKVNNKYLSPDERRNRVDDFRNLWGSKYIVFPNTYYGDWEACLYNNRNLSDSPSKKYIIRDSLLKTINYIE